MADERLSKKSRLRGIKQYRDHFRHAQRQSTSALVLHLRPTPSAVVRLGFAVSRKLGKACQRNRVKRQLREIVRRRKKVWESAQAERQGGFDLVIQPKDSAMQCSYGQLERQVIEGVERFLSRTHRGALKSKRPTQRNKKHGS